MSELPVFALQETVVFPGMTIPLYVFEERYKLLVRQSVEVESGRFIITLQRPQAEVSDIEADFYRIGTFADILSASENADGTFDIVVHGQDRCKLKVTRRERVPEAGGQKRPLAYSSVCPYPLERSDPNLERVAAWDCIDTFRSYAREVLAPEAAKKVEAAIPDDLLYQASFVCANVRVPAVSKQVMLEATSLLGRFQVARKLMIEQLDSK